MTPRATACLAALSLAVAMAGVAVAQPTAPPSAGGPAPGRVPAIGRDAGPAPHPPRTDSPQAVNRGTDGSAAGLDADPNATGTSPQGMLGQSTAGDRGPAAATTPPPTPRR